MALHPGSLATIAELKRYMPAVGKGKDLELEEALGRATEDCEGEGLGGRRGVYRGPIESYTSIAAAQSIKTRVDDFAGVLDIAGAPDAAGRTIVVRKVDADRSITAGILTVDQAAPPLSETFTLSDGNEIHGVKFFTAAVTATLSGCAGHQETVDTIEVGTSEGYTELYSPCPCQHEIKPIEWPIQHVVDVREDFDRLFGSDTVLVAGSDYEVRNHGSILRAIARLAAGRDSVWVTGRRCVLCRLSAGWVGPRGVPARVKGVCLELAAWHFQHSERKQYGLQSRTTDAGTFSFTGPPMLTDGMLKRLAPEWRAENMPTGERGWSETEA